MFSCSANEVFPELKDLETLPMHDMALRLCFLFDHYDKNPVCDRIRFACIFTNCSTALPLSCTINLSGLMQTLEQGAPAYSACITS